LSSAYSPAIRCKLRAVIQAQPIVAATKKRMMVDAACDRACLAGELLQKLLSLVDISAESFLSIRGEQRP
jgi:hypothetical protein